MIGVCAPAVGAAAWAGPAQDREPSVKQKIVSQRVGFMWAG
jgi:hypothetical protein